jgi:hypothetical protein
LGIVEAIGLIDIRIRKATMCAQKILQEFGLLSDTYQQNLKGLLLSALG